MLETNKTPVLILSIDDLQNMIEYIKEGNKKIGYSRVHKREIGCFNLPLPKIINDREVYGGLIFRKIGGCP